jgi:predicted ATP-dependent protease
MMKADTSAITDAHLDKFAAIDLNGRQIKNAVKMAGLLAAKNKHHLTTDHVEMMLAIAQSS